MTGVKVFALAFVLFGILDLIGVIEFPDTMLLIVLTQPPDWLSWLVIIVLPILCIGFGLFMFINRRLSTATLSIVCFVYSVMHIWAIPKLPYWEHLSQGRMSLIPGVIEMKVVGGLFLFVAAPIYLLLSVKKSK